MATAIIDVWTQFISPTPPGMNPQGENVFRNYGMLDVFHHGTDVAKMIDVDGPPRRADRAHGRRQRGVAKAQNAVPRPHLRPVPRRPDATS